MGTRDKRIDAIIAKSPDFAQPILTTIRETVHEACPDVEETLKWGMPTFMYHGMLCHMAAFKQHCALGFWKGALVFGGRAGRGEAMGNFGRLTTVKDLPSRRDLMKYVKQAMKLNEAGTRVTRPRKAAKPPVKTPADLAAALKKNRKAAATWDGFAPSHRREYAEWITGAKQAATRERRLKQAVEWMAEGKARNWKYEKC
jgi:uncharacterized protein YdeI (YjbR/CyaY-like superfamily)